MIAVVGAGMAGLVAARQLARAGRTVVVVDKGRGVGGRLATRRVGGAVFDHGAQFFTVRGDDLAADVADWLGDGLVYEWCRGFGRRPDGHPRYAVRGGFTALAKHLAATPGVEVRTGVEVQSLSRGWRIGWDGGGLDAEALLLTPPLPQTLTLLATAGIDVPELADRPYEPTLSVMAVLDGPSAVPDPGGAQVEDGPFSFVADNQRKGVSPVSAVTLHANAEVSAARLDDPPEAVLADLLAEAEPWLGGSAVVAAELKRWRYATALEPWSDRCFTVPGGPPLVLAGDAYGGPKVEGAYHSGLAAAAAILDRT